MTEGATWLKSELWTLYDRTDKLIVSQFPLTPELYEFLWWRYGSYVQPSYGVEELLPVALSLMAG